MPQSGPSYPPYPAATPQRLICSALVPCSRIPAIHNAALQQKGLYAVYVPLLVDDMASFLSTFTGTRLLRTSCAASQVSTLLFDVG